MHFIPPPKCGLKSKSIHVGNERRQIDVCMGLVLCGYKQLRQQRIKYHNMNNGRVRHPGYRSVEFSIFLTFFGELPAKIA